LPNIFRSLLLNKYFELGLSLIKGAMYLVRSLFQGGSLPSTLIPLSGSTTCFSSCCDKDSAITSTTGRLPDVNPPWNRSGCARTARPSSSRYFHIYYLFVIWVRLSLAPQPTVQWPDVSPVLIAANNEWFTDMAVVLRITAAELQNVIRASC
jgi:hypothetical protein